MIGVSPNPARSRFLPGMALTRPSIMSLGATMSAPASTWLAAVRASSLSLEVVQKIRTPDLLLHHAAMAILSICEQQGRHP